MKYTEKQERKMMSEIPTFTAKLAFTEHEARSFVQGVSTTGMLGMPADLADVLRAIAEQISVELAKYTPLAAGDRVYYVNDKNRLGTTVHITDPIDDSQYVTIRWDEAGRSPVTTVPLKNVRRA